MTTEERTTIHVVDGEFGEGCDRGISGIGIDVVVGGEAEPTHIQCRPDTTLTALRRLIEGGIDDAPEEYRFLWPHGVPVSWKQEAVKTVADLGQPTIVIRSAVCEHEDSVRTVSALVVPLPALLDFGEHRPPRPLRAPLTMHPFSASPGVDVAAIRALAEAFIAIGLRGCSEPRHRPG